MYAVRTVTFGVWSIRSFYLVKRYSFITLKFIASSRVAASAWEWIFFVSHSIISLYTKKAFELMRPRPRWSNATQQHVTTGTNGQKTETREKFNKILVKPFVDDDFMKPLHAHIQWFSVWISRCSMYMVYPYWLIDFNLFRLSPLLVRSTFSHPS